MLFNSLEYIFFFLPVVALCIYIAGNRFKFENSLYWLVVLLSFYFMYQSSSKNLRLFLCSLFFNYLCSKLIIKENNGSKKKILLSLGISSNLFLLGYYKYTNFLFEILTSLGMSVSPMAKIVLPLGISFYTFQQMAFLVDVYSGQIQGLTIRKYFFFVSFFPQIVAGPIVNYSEIEPQVNKKGLKLEAENISVGISIFILGLFKKIVFADSMSRFVHPAFNAISRGENLSFLESWCGLLSFALQVYFDFSGYSDMAIGVARIFGIKLPLNFHSPYKATNIADFWRRWHITLTRFLTTYVYNTLTLKIVRKHPRTKFNKKFSSYFRLMAMPTVVTMVISGVWHGAGEQFVFFGLLHGVYILVFHCWVYLTKKTIINKWKKEFVYRRIAHLVTLIFVLLSWIYFRAPDIENGTRMLKGCLGLNGFGVPVNLFERLSVLSSFLNLEKIHYVSMFEIRQIPWIIILGFIALTMPTTQEIMGDYNPAIGYTNVSKNIFGLKWKATRFWGAIIGFLFAFTLFKINEVSDFLYWHF